MRRVIRPVVLGGSVKSTPEEVYDANEGYKPRSIPRAEAERLRPVAVGLVAKATPQTPNEALTLLVPAFRHVYWADCQGYSLEPSKLMVPDRIEEFHSYCLARLSADSARTWRSLLRRLGPVNAPQAWGATPRRDKHSEPDPPYSEQQQAEYFRCVFQQATEGRRRVLWKRLNIGLGAGFMPNDYMWVKREHVTVTNDGLTLIRVPEEAVCPRIIPVLGRYAQAVREIAEQCPDGEPLFGRLNPLAKDPVPALLTRVEIPSRLPALTTDRLRRTYIVSLLNADLRVSEVMAFAGLKTMSTIQSLLPYVRSRLDGDVAYRKAAEALI